MVSILDYPLLILSAIIGYFLLLIGISWWTTRQAKNEQDSFFIGSRQSPWYLVAFGMIGASLSGVTFISIPGVVSGSGANQAFSYIQVVMGYIVGYFITALVLLPLYYRMQLTSIYTYLEHRFGFYTYKTGAAFFLLSRSIGSSFRLFLVAMVFDQIFIGLNWPIPFFVTVGITILLIWIYTFKGGIKTIVWTDSIQTFFMLASLGLSIWFLAGLLPEFETLEMAKQTLYTQDRSQCFFFENAWEDKNHFIKQFIAGVFIAIVMTGLDQDMMQKNISCRNLKEAQRNMYVFSSILFFVNVLFLLLGFMLALYAEQLQLPNASDILGSDKLYPYLALEQLPPIVGLCFLLGLIAAAYSSADSALTALTTSFCIDFLGFQTTGNSPYIEIRQRRQVHIAFSFLLYFLILIFWWVNDRSIINTLFSVAGYTYGPLLGFYTFGLFSTKKIKDPLILPVACIALILTYILSSYSKTLLWGYEMGFEKLLVNAAITILGLYCIQSKEIPEENNNIELEKPSTN